MTSRAEDGSLGKEQPGLVIRTTDIPCFIAGVALESWIPVSFWLAWALGVIGSSAFLLHLRRLRLRE